ncbi:3-hydroxyacyl-[acyl-carrier-protein] dehydratase/UDP-3-O-[3-hydroxymyristoyl] N-acetylglucosamine deacetylase / 3-hydroxyacyl-[acyl-carrier-protein] dehydratase [Parelusimicrobium proximum]|uniref:3-hydroxyacyl-ACP dehydratase FabZ n=1 Tax=Parelusimicrobium proximum TaxID=3228953 RepID=UPI003D16B03F
MSAEQKNLKHLLDAKPVRVVTYEDVLKNIPHRPPMLFVDKVNIIEEYKTFIGEKTFPAAEDFYKGHFPSMPITPGVFLIESMSQCFGAAVMGTPDLQGKLAFFLSIEEAKFRHPVNPGDKILMPIHTLRFGKISRIYAEAYVNGVLCCEGKLNFVLGDK